MVLMFQLLHRDTGYCRIINVPYILPWGWRVALGTKPVWTTHAKKRARVGQKWESRLWTNKNLDGPLRDHVVAIHVAFSSSSIFFPTSLLGLLSTITWAHTTKDILQETIYNAEA